MKPFYKFLSCILWGIFVAILPLPFHINFILSCLGGIAIYFISEYML